MKICRKIVAGLLLVGILANCFNYWIISTSYHFNKSYISSVLCTNKDKPERHCEGKCFLDIKLKELEQKNKQEQEHMKRVIETVAPFSASLVFKTFETEVETAIPNYLQQKPVGITSIIFHPPKVA
jgi:predicted alpha/beta superfamily hydrolase